MTVPGERWYLTGSLGIGTSFDEPTDAQTQPGATWTNVGTAIRHPQGDALNLLDGRDGAPNQGPSLSLWGINSAKKAVRLGLVTSRFTSAKDGTTSGYLAFHTKGPGRDLSEALRVSETGTVGVGTTTPRSRLQIKSLTAMDEGITTVGAWANFGSNTYFDGAWKRIDGAKAGANLHINADGGGQEFRFLRMESNGTSRNLAVLGSTTSYILEGNVGIGTTTPGARLDVSGGGGAYTCCAPVPPTLALSEAASTSGRRAWLQFHNVNEAEAYIRLAGGGAAGSGREGPRRLEIGDSQGASTSLTVLGNIGVGLPQGAAPAARLHVAGGDIRLDAGQRLFAPGRLHIDGDEILWVRSRGGVVIGKEAGGNGNLQVQGDILLTGRIGVLGQPATPRTGGWAGGIRTWDLEVEGSAWCRGRWETGNRDVAEGYASDAALEPGEVVCFDRAGDTIVRAAEPNDTLVCGVISTRPGVLLNADRDVDAPNLFPVALCGRVPCKVVDENGPIERGDLLTSSSTAGHAMKARPVWIDGRQVFQTGTIIGKALEPLAHGTGVIEMFVARG